jgi:hypothetical protein
MNLRGYFEKHLVTVDLSPTFSTTTLPSLSILSLKPCVNYCPTQPRSSGFKASTCVTDTHHLILTSQSPTPTALPTLLGPFILSFNNPQYGPNPFDCIGPHSLIMRYFAKHKLISIFFLSPSRQYLSIAPPVSSSPPPQQHTGERELISQTKFIHFVNFFHTLSPPTAKCSKSEFYSLSISLFVCLFVCVYVYMWVYFYVFFIIFGKLFLGLL